MRFVRTIAYSLYIAALTACGSGTGNEHNPGLTVAPAPASKTRAQFVITIPHATATATGSRRAQYISPATLSIDVNVIGTGSTANPAGYPQIANLTPTSSGCTSNLASTLCTIVLSLNAGTYSATISTYDQLGGTGNVLSAAQSVPFTVVAGQQNTVGLALSGVPASTIIVPVNAAASVLNVATGNYDLRYPGIHAFYVESLDADSNFIIGSGAPTYTIGTPSGVLSGVTATIGATTPNLLLVTPPTALASGTASFTVTPNFTGQQSDGCAQGGAVCTATTVSVDMEPTLFAATRTGVLEFDQNANSIATSGSFPGVSDAVGIVYAPSNGLLYVLDDGTNSIEAYDLNGNAQTLTGTFPLLALPAAITYDPENGFLYVANFSAPPPTDQVMVYDTQGNEQAASSAFPGLSGPLGITYDSQNALVYVLDFATVAAFTPAGVSSPLSGAITTYNAQGNILFDPANGFLYVNGNSGMFVYDGSGNQQTLTGSFAASGGNYTMSFDASNGLFYDPESFVGVRVYDQQGNTQSLSFPGPGSIDYRGIAVVP